MPRTKISEAKKEQDRKYRESHKEQIRAYREANKEKMREYMLRWRAKNKERREEYRRRYRAAHPEVKKRSDQKYYAKIKADPDKLAARRKYVVWQQSQPKNKKRRAEYAKRRRQDPGVRARHAANLRRHYHKKPVQQRKAEREKLKPYQREYRTNNADRLKDHARAFRAANRARLNAKSREQYRKNPLPYIQRARKRMGFLTGTYTDADIKNLYEQQRGICRGCRCELNGKFEIDHIMPLALDPTGDKLENLQLLCKPCNRAKHALHPDEWAKRIGKLFI